MIFTPIQGTEAVVIQRYELIVLVLKGMAGFSINLVLRIDNTRNNSDVRLDP